MPRSAPLARAAANLGLAAVLLLAAGCNGQTRLPGVRIPVRPEEAPLSQTKPGEIRPVAVPAPVVNADWTHRNGAAGGRLTDPALAPMPQLRWAVNIGEGDARRRRVLTAPIVAGGLVFTIDAAGRLSAVTQSGQLTWTKSLVPPAQLSDSGLGGGFAAAGGVLYVATGFGEVSAVDPATGNTIWTRSFEGPIRAAPTVLDGRVFIVVRDDTAFGLDARSGDTLWKAQAAGGTGLLGGASPAADGQLVVVPFASGEVLGLLARNGLQVWGTAITGGRPELARNSIVDISGAPVIDGSVIYASNQAGRTVALDRDTGERKWTTTQGAYGPAWPVGNSVFVMSDEGALVRIDAATGQQDWVISQQQYYNERKRIEAIAYYGPVLAGGRLWVATADGWLRAFDPQNGSLLGQVALPGGAGAPPAVAGGVMYVVSRQGQLLAFQ